MKTTLQLGVILALLAGTLDGGGEKPKDVDGWGKIKWGMTLAEARAAYNADAPLDEGGYYTELKLKPIEIGNLEMNVTVWAKRGTDRISVVNLTYLSLPEHRASPSEVETLKTLLTQKYGSPTGDETEIHDGLLGQSRTRTIVWAFPSATIHLTVFQFVEDPATGVIAIEYKATDKKALDVL
ncbi:MAG TPA: hypothetical protein VMR62_38410 [Bryobacteraceae bacterium]|jgi:hypothetical protein|nr:hypothetical protein [Bryobacteraceae bacterium]